MWKWQILFSFYWIIIQFSSVQSLSCVRLFATTWIAARQASLSITISRSSLRLTFIRSVNATLGGNSLCRCSQLKWSHTGLGGLKPGDWCPCKKREVGAETPRGKRTWWHTGWMPCEWSGVDRARHAQIADNYLYAYEDEDLRKDMPPIPARAWCHWHLDFRSLIERESISVV